MSFRSSVRAQRKVTRPTSRCRPMRRACRAPLAGERARLRAVRVRCRSRCTLRCSCYFCARAGAARQHRRRGDLGRDRARRERDRGRREDAGRGPEHQPNSTIRPTRSRSSRSARPTQRATEQPQTVQVGRRRPRPSRSTTLERQADEPTPADNAAAPREQRQPAESKPAIAMVTSPDPEMATAAPREIPPDTMDVSLLPQPEEKPVETPEPKPAEAEQPVERNRSRRSPSRSPCRPRAEAGEERRQGQGAPPHRCPDPREGRCAKPRRRRAIRRSAGSGRGAGRSSNDTNYRGLVSAHLARHKQYPADARSPRRPRQRDASRSA